MFIRIRYPDPVIKVNDTVKLDLTTGKISDFIKVILHFVPLSSVSEIPETDDSWVVRHRCSSNGHGRTKYGPSGHRYPP